jgi:hypothetical protein
MGMKSLFLLCLICGLLAQNGSRAGVSYRRDFNRSFVGNATRHGEVASKAHENVAEATLSCALALPDDPMRKFQLLRTFLERYGRIPPGYDIILVNEDERPIGKEYTATRIYIDGLQVWLKKGA